MRKLLISIAGAGAALAVATPAAAQYYPQGYGYNGYGNNGYGNNGYNYGYDGYGNFGQVRALQSRIDALENQIRMLDRRNFIRDDSADRLRDEAQRLERRLHRAARYGLNGYEANDIQGRLARLEQHVRYASQYRYQGYGRGYGYNGYGDRDDRYDHDWDRGRDRNDD